MCPKNGNFYRTSPGPSGHPMNQGALATGKRLILIRCAAHHPKGEGIDKLHFVGHEK